MRTGKAFETVGSVSLVGICYGERGKGPFQNIEILLVFLITNALDVWVAVVKDCLRKSAAIHSNRASIVIL